MKRNKWLRLAGFAKYSMRRFVHMYAIFAMAKRVVVKSVHI